MPAQFNVLITYFAKFYRNDNRDTNLNKFL